MSFFDEISDQSEDSEIEDTEIVVAPSLYVRPTFFRQTRGRGKILKNVSERYLRDDIGFGCYFAASDSTKRRSDETVGKPQVIETVQHLLTLLKPCNPNALVICDTNVLLHNMDVIEQSIGVMPNLVIPQTSLIECRSNRMVAYDQTVQILRSVGGKLSKRFCIFFADQHHVETACEDENCSNQGDTINDRNDERIRKVASYFGKNLRGSNVRVILLTDDADSRRKASKDRYGKDPLYEAKTVRAWTKELETKNPGVALTDLVAQYGSSAKVKVEGEDLHFPRHKEAVELSRGVKLGMFHRGVLRSNDQSAAIVTIRRGEERVAVTIEGSTDRNRALDGDLVAIALNPLDKWIPLAAKPAPIKSSNNSTVGISNITAEPSEGEISCVPESLTLEEKAESLRPTGRVVGILRRNFSNYSGSIYERKPDQTSHHGREETYSKYEQEHPDGSSTCVFIPVDKKVPPILIRTTQRARLLAKRIVVAVDSWPIHSPYPLGHYIRTIGVSGSKDVETEVLLHQYKIPYEPFPATVLACLPPKDYIINEENSPGRLDLRHLPILSIDPPGCTDIDDALHCIKLPNGNLQVGVHIADVTHFVKAGTAIDLEAANRATSTYLVNKRLDMLPALLSTDLCSLKEKVDRYAFSVIWEMTNDADVVKVDFHKSIIRSIAALTYQEAQSLIDHPNENGDAQIIAVKGLAQLARKLSKRRIDAGALTLASPEVKFVLDSESLNPTDVQAYALFEANNVIMEFMLLANIAVGKKILRHYPTLSVLRRHPAPSRAMFDSLISKARCRGFEIDIEDSKQLADSLDNAVLDSDKYFNKLLRILSTRCLSPAQYFCSGEFKPTEWHHYGLAAPVYTHFTSPIRRYADVLVHRLLAAAIGVAPLPVHLSSRSYLHDLCANMNRRQRSANYAGRESVQLHTLLFFASEGAKEESAYVLDVETAENSEPSFTVLIPRYGIEGKVMLPISADDECLSRDPSKHCISYENKEIKASVRVFDKVKVRIWVQEFQDHQKELVLDLLEPAFSSKNNIKRSDSVVKASQKDSKKRKIK